MRLLVLFPKSKAVLWFFRYGLDRDGLKQRHRMVLPYVRISGYPLSVPPLPSRAWEPVFLLVQRGKTFASMSPPRPQRGAKQQVYCSRGGCELNVTFTPCR